MAKKKRSRSEAGKAGKLKGSRFERNIVKQFSQMWPDGEYTRTPGSGGSNLKEGWDMAGDIVTTSPTFPFCVECKHREGWHLEGIFSEKHAVYKWWKQAAEDASVVGKPPLLVFTRNYQKLFMAMRLRSWPKDLKKPKVFIKTPKFFITLFEELAELAKHKGAFHEGEAEREEGKGQEQS
jgi:Holliday junction resolvase